LPRTDISAVLRAPWNDAIRQAAGSFQHANVEYICTEGWISDVPGSEDLADGVHLSAVGHQKIANELKNRLLYGHALQDIVVIAGEG
jgi:lysophospholipase L1-like esterase